MVPRSQEGDLAEQRRAEKPVPEGEHHQFRARGLQYLQELIPARCSINYESGRSSSSSSGHTRSTTRLTWRRSNEPETHQDRSRLRGGARPCRPADVCPAGNAEGDELELWAHLVEEYEEEHYPIDLPDPIAAIRFRMDQQDLKPADLIPYIGSKSKVSEVLNRKRPLSLAMIRKLHSGLGIPAEVLLQRYQEQPSPAFEDMNWREFPLAEIVRRRWFGNTVNSSRELLERAEELLGPYLSPPGFSAETARLRRSFGKGVACRREGALGVESTHMALGPGSEGGAL